MSGVAARDRRTGLALDRVFSAGESADGLAFHPAPAPTDAEVAETLPAIRHRVRRLLMRRVWGRARHHQG
jgi:hypothetical protein